MGNPICKCGCGNEVRKPFHKFIFGHHQIWKVSRWVERFWSKVEKTSECWIWKGGLAKSKDKSNSRFYGSFHRRIDQKLVASLAHRLSYELVKGEIPDGLVIDHTCRNTLCVNPDHLEPVTQRENLLRGNTENAKNNAKTHCLRGHEFTPENTYLRDDGKRRTRHCRLCAKIRAEIYKQRIKGVA